MVHFICRARLYIIAILYTIPSTISLQRVLTRTILRSTMQTSIMTNDKVNMKPSVCIIGGGNAAHALAALLPFQARLKMRWNGSTLVNAGWLYCVR